MNRPMLGNIEVAYRGLDADKHWIDLTQAGLSLGGIGRLYNSAAHFYFHGRVPARNYRPLIRSYIGVPEKGSVDFWLLLSVIQEHLPTYSEILFKYAPKAIPELIKAVFAKRTGDHRTVEKALEVIEKMSDNQTSLMHAMLQKDAATEKHLFALVDKLTENNRAPMAEMVAPVGNSCHSITHFAHTEHEITIDEPTAAVMRSKENLEVGTQTDFIATILGVDRETGSCRIEFSDDHSVVRGKITDPALQTPHNVYTSALNTQKTVVLTAKPVKREGEIKSLYISDARFA